MAYRGLAIPLLAFLVAGRAFALDAVAPPGWSEASRDGNIVIFSKDGEKTDAHTFRAIGEADATPEEVFRVVTDVDSHSKFMPFTKESHILKRLSPTEVIAYQVISPPMISQRDFHLHITLTPGTNGKWGSQWTNLRDFEPERPGYVRVPVAEGSWAFEPLDGGKRTRITYTSLTDIGGSIPGWIANMSSLRVIPDMFTAVKKRLADVLKSAPATAPVTASK